LCTELAFSTVAQTQNVGLKDYKDTMTRRLTVLFALLAVLVMPALATASTVTLTDWTTPGNFLNNADGGGGPFEAKTTGGALGVADFITFCIEFNEEFNYGATYDFALSDGAKNGGVSGHTSTNFDPLSDATKWLYYEVVSGSYSSMYHAATGLDLSNNNDVGANFQYAIWYLEDERTVSEIGGSTSAGLNLANYALAHQNWSDLFKDGNRVYAMNLTDAAGGLHQDQLAYGVVPEPGSLMLLGTGLLVLSRKLLSRRVRG
jgi:hypothetical protein